MTVDGKKLEPITRAKAIGQPLRALLGTRAFFDDDGTVCGCRIVGALDDAIVADWGGDTVVLPFGKIYTATPKAEKTLWQSCIKTKKGR